MRWNLETLHRLKRKDIFGLDIGSDAVKMVKLSKNGSEYTVTAAGLANIANNDGNNDTAIADAIINCLNGSDIGTRLAVCSVSGSEVASRSFKFPSMLPEEIAGAVQFEAAQVCPFSSSDATVDYQLIHNDTDGARGVLVTATNPMIERKKQFAMNAHLNCCLMDVDGLALLNCFDECEKPQKQEPVIILNIGASLTNLVIKGGNDLPFIRDIAFGGNDIIHLIAEEKSVSPEIIAANLFDSEDSCPEPMDINSCLDSACQKLVVDIKESLRYHKTQGKSASAEKIFICGGFALAKGLIEILNNRLNATVLLWNPFEKINCRADSNCFDLLKKKGPAMAVAAGLAMRSV